jgi:hypothetical protein
MSEALSLVDQETAHRRSTLAPWAQEVVERAQELRDALEYVHAGHRAHLASLIDAAEELVYAHVRLWHWMTRLSDWWYGSRVEQAWSHLHQAELQFVEYADKRGMEIALDSALGHAEILPANDPVRLRFEAYLRSLVENSTHQRTMTPASATWESVP